MTVFPKMTATEFIQQLVCPYAHPQATDLAIIEQDIVEHRQKTDAETI